MAGGSTSRVEGALLDLLRLVRVGATKDLAGDLEQRVVVQRGVEPPAMPPLLVGADQGALRLRAAVASGDRPVPQSAAAAGGVGQL